MGWSGRESERGGSEYSEEVAAGHVVSSDRPVEAITRPRVTAELMPC
jgi:hypothetical protein